MKNSLLISTGGSGGHVIPATILYEHLAQQNSVIISIDKRGLKYLDKNNYQFEIIDTPKLSNFLLLPINLIIILFLTCKSLFFLKKKKVNIMFSTGGYMSLPLILAARVLKLKLYLLEPNHVLGRANRYFLKSCTKIFCYSKKIKNFPDKYQDKKIVINPLVKKKIYDLKSQKKITDKFTILVVGGSQGAKIFDDKLKDIVVNLSKKNSIKIVQQTNKKNISYLANFYKENNIENKIFNFTQNFEQIIYQSDLCITRAGASTLAELSVLSVPFITVPLPTAKDDHQYENAHFFKNKDCCWMVEQKNFEEQIQEILMSIFEKKDDYLNKKENLKKLNYQNTWINDNQKILEIINEN